jgi:hypothetical protein
MPVHEGVHPPSGDVGGLGGQLICSRPAHRPPPPEIRLVGTTTTTTTTTLEGRTRCSRHTETRADVYANKSLVMASFTGPRILFSHPLPALKLKLQLVVVKLLLLFITAVPNTKLCAWGEEDREEHVL